MNIKQMFRKIGYFIKQNAYAKQIVLRGISAQGSARPRFWVRLLVNPLIHRKGRSSHIRWSVRKDLFPYNNFSMGHHSYVEDFSTLNNGVGDIIIGHHTRVGIGCTLIGPVALGNNVHLAQNVVVSGLNHNYQDVTQTIRAQGVSTNDIIIEDDVWIGANCVITAGVRIGTHSVVAAGSVVTKSIPPFSVWAGVPARPIKEYKRELNTWVKV